MAKFLDQSGLAYFIDKLKSKFVTQSDYGLPLYYVETGDVPASGTYQTKTVTPTESTQVIEADSGYDALESVTVNAISSTYVGSGVTRQAAATITPATSSQVAVAADRYTTGAVTVGAIPSQYIVPSGSQTITENGTYDVSDKASVVVDVESSGGLNWQIDNGNGRVANTSYTDTGLSITVAVTGTYNVYWSGFRNTTSGTSGSQLYVNGSSRGSAQTTFQNSYIQTPKLTGISLNAGDVVTLRARSRASNYYMCVGNLIIEQTS